MSTLEFRRISIVSIFVKFFGVEMWVSQKSLLTQRPRFEFFLVVGKGFKNIELIHRVLPLD